jgi:hypothetical protein
LRFWWVSFGNFLFGNTYNFVKQCNIFYIRMPTLNYNSRYESKILIKNFL